MPANRATGGHLIKLEFLLLWLLLCFGNFNRDGVNVDELASAFAFGEDNSAVDEGVERVVLAHANVLAGVVDCATLTFDYVACFGKLATEYLDAESFAF